MLLVTFGSKLCTGYIYVVQILSNFLKFVSFAISVRTYFLTWTSLKINYSFGFENFDHELLLAVKFSWPYNLKSLKYRIYHHEKQENEVVVGPLGNFWASLDFSYWIRRSELPVSNFYYYSRSVSTVSPGPHALKCHKLTTILVSRDYDLSLICTSKCDDAYLQCVSICSDSNCLLDCNRASIACTEGKNIATLLQSES